MSMEPETPPTQQVSQLPPARRRRARRSLIPSSNDERAALLENLARKAFPSFEFFLFSLLAGAIMGAGFMFDSQGILLLGVLITPLMVPWVGIALATVTGAGRFFLQTLAGFLISAGLIFGTSWLAGIATQIRPPKTDIQAIIHTHLWPANLFVLLLGSVLLVISFIRSEQRPILPSLMLAYGLFLPLSAAGFGLGSGISDFWPNGGLVFLVHLALASLAALLTLFVLGFRPRRISGCFMTLVIFFTALVVFIWLTGAGTFVLNLFNFPTRVSPTQATQQFSGTSAPGLSTPATLPGETSIPSLTPTLFILPSTTPTVTPTPQPTPIYARIYADTGQGANVRVNPGNTAPILVSLVNDTLVEILPEIEVVEGVTWLHIRTTDGIVGWIIQSLVVTATPAPGW